MISIILTTYNDGNYLHESLPSCLSQKGVDFEVIVVDDCSTIPLPIEVLNTITVHPNVTLVRKLSNQGLAAARNTGVGISKGHLLVPLDADDQFKIGALAHLLAAVDDEHDIFYGDITSAGHRVKPTPQPWTKETFLQGNPLFCTSLFTRRMWKAIGGYLEKPTPSYEDHRLWCAAFMRGYRFKYVPELIYEHREREDSMLRKLHPNRQFYHDLATEPIRRGW